MRRRDYRVPDRWSGHPVYRDGRFVGMTAGTRTTEHGTRVRIVRADAADLWVSARELTGNPFGSVIWTQSN
jgi:hypothetical protein